MLRSCIFSIVCLLTATPAMTGTLQDPNTEPEAMSLLGKPLMRPVLHDEQRRKLEANLSAALQQYESNPEDPDALIWLGRRTAYLGRYREAVEVYTKGLEMHPGDPRILRHRGHRYISVRLLDQAIADLSRAAALIEGQPDEIEPDGIPNARNQPTSTTHSNIWYHLGLAHYLSGDFDKALGSYRNCLGVSRNDDMKVASLYWLYLTLQKLGRFEEARNQLSSVHLEMDIIENHTYRDLLLLFKGERTPEQILGEDQDPLTSATAGYGVGCWHRFNGREPEAWATFERVVAGEQWAAFGYLAAEAELARQAGLQVK